MSDQETTEREIDGRIADAVASPEGVEGRRPSEDFSRPGRIIYTFVPAIFTCILSAYCAVLGGRLIDTQEVIGFTGMCNTRQGFTALGPKDTDMRIRALNQQIRAEEATGHGWEIHGGKVFSAKTGQNLIPNLGLAYFSADRVAFTGTETDNQYNLYLYNVHTDRFARYPLFDAEPFTIQQVYPVIQWDGTYVISLLLATGASLSDIQFSDQLAGQRICQLPRGEILIRIPESELSKAIVEPESLEEN